MTVRYLVPTIGLIAWMSGAPATAADMARPVYKAPPAAVADIWAGLYGGLNVGGALARNPTNTTTVLPGAFDPVFDIATFSHAPGGAIFGLQAGYNWHAAPSWVVGVETDWQYANHTDTTCGYACLPRSNPPALLADNDNQTMHWFATARGRLGFLTPGGSLLYATGGAAWARIDQSLTLIGDTFFAPGAATSVNVSQTRLGWTIGAGIETPVADRLTLKAEYLFVDLGAVTNSFTTPLSALAALDFPSATVAVTTSTSDIREHVARVGLNYHFDGGGPAMAYGGAYASAAPARREWTGFYGGVNAGVALARNPTNNPFILSGPTVNPLFDFPVAGNDFYSHSPFGGVLGGQVGVNWQVGSFLVIGAEADWQWTHQTDSACVSECLPPDPAAFLIPLGITDDQTMHWIGTLRGRVGWVAANGTMWYLTGGAAYGRFDETVSVIAAPAFFAIDNPVTQATFIHDKVGWTVGGGTEIPLWDRWSVKAEYLYVDFGRVNDSFTSALGLFQFPATAQTTSSVYSVHDHIARFGLNYHFN